MQKTVLIIFFVIWYSTSIGQKQICVDGSFTGNPENGSPSNPYRTIQAAINEALSGDTIKVAKGMYSAQALQIVEKKVHLLGGYAGSGDFNHANPLANETLIEGTEEAPCIFIDIQGASIAGSMTISGFTIRNGQRGIELSGGWSGFLDNIAIENNIIENNGTTGTSQRGGGIGLDGKNVIIRKNVIRNNRSDRGAAIGGTSSHIENFLVADNIIDSNKGYGDHGGGMIISGTGTITRNIFDSNVTAMADPSYGWGGAICVVNEDTLKLITLSHNIYRNNYAPDRGGAVFVDEAAKVLMEHELFYDNRTKKSGSAIYVDEHWDHTPSVLYMNNCTVWGNSTDEPDGAALFVQSSSAHIQNCIFWNNGSDFDSVAEGHLSVEYTLTQKGFAGSGNISSDPLFADAPNGDFHLKSTNGRFNPITEEWENDEVNSPAIDAGNPSSDYSNEIEPNGGRVNLGCYGNTPEASKSKANAVVNETALISWTIFPNPAKGNITIAPLQSGSNVIITNIAGRKVFNAVIKSERININTAAFDNGVYIIQVVNNGAVEAKKFIVRK